MDNPRLFIGSSTEGKRLARALFKRLSESTAPTLWTNSVFLPGRFPIEELERRLRASDFAVFVATPDDELTKHGESTLTMRDNVLLEFGLFVGIVGRRRVFLVVPDKPQISVPSDLLGISTARYDAARSSSNDESDLAAAVEIAADDIQAAVGQEWASVKFAREFELETARNSERGKAIRRLYGVAITLRDAVLVIQRESVASLFDEGAFESIKAATIEKVRETAESFRADAQSAGAERQLDGLRDATVAALQEFPSPKMAIDAPSIAAIASIGANIAQLFAEKGEIDKTAILEVGNKAQARSADVLRVYSDWWNRHRPALERATDEMRDVLFERSTNLLLDSERAARKV